MGIAERPKTALEEQLSYWKWDFTTVDLFSSELAYSLIYDNIRPDRIAEALQTVGLTALPNYFILIQIDGYLALSKQLEITREFFQKDLVVNTIREYLSELSLPGFAANLINSDRVICFLCLDEGLYAPITEYLRTFISEIRRRVQLYTTYTLSVSFSGQCSGLSHFPSMYIQMAAALDRSFYHGQGAYLDTGSEDMASSSFEQRLHYADILAAVSQRDEPMVLERVERLFQALKKSRLPPQQIRIETVRLIYRFEDYCLDCAVPEQSAAAISRQYVERVLSSQFFSNIQTLFFEFCVQISHILEQYYADRDGQFKIPVQAYIGEHYRHPIRLADIAQVLNFSPCYFTQVFKQAFGMTFVQYLTRFRVEKSQALLARNNCSVEDVAFRVGFSSPGYFCTTFRRLVGMSPRAYQERSRQS